MHKVLVNHLVKLAQEKSVVRQTYRPHMTVAVDWDIKNQTKLIDPEKHPGMFEKLFTGMKVDKP